MTLRVLLESIIVFILSIVFFASGFSKLADQHWDLEDFEKLGMGFQMIHMIGAAEILAALGLYVDRYRTWAATVLAIISFGAIVVHVILNDLVEMGGPLVLGALSGALVYFISTAPKNDNASSEKQKS